MPDAAASASVTRFCTRWRSRSHDPGWSPDDEVNDEHNWAARGFLRFQPPDTDLDFVLNAHGSRLDQDPTLGQAIGTRGSRGLAVQTPIRFGGQPAGSGYVEPDVTRGVRGALRPDRHVAGRIAGLPAIPSPVPAREELAEDAAARPQALPRRLQPRRRDDARHLGRLPERRRRRARRHRAVRRSAPTTATSASATPTPTSRPTSCSSMSRTTRPGRSYEELQLDGELEAEPLEWEVGGYYLYEDARRRRRRSSCSRTRTASNRGRTQPGHRQLRRVGRVHAGTSSTTSRSRAACAGTGSTRTSTSRVHHRDSPSPAPTTRRPSRTRPGRRRPAS